MPDHRGLQAVLRQLHRISDALDGPRDVFLLRGHLEHAVGRGSVVRVSGGHHYVLRRNARQFLRPRLRDVELLAHKDDEVVLHVCNLSLAVIEDDRFAEQRVADILGVARRERSSQHGTQLRRDIYFGGPDAKLAHDDPSLRMMLTCVPIVCQRQFFLREQRGPAGMPLTTGEMHECVGPSCAG